MSLIKTNRNMSTSQHVYSNAVQCNGVLLYFPATHVLSFNLIFIVKWEIALSFLIKKLARLMSVRFLLLLLLESGLMTLFYSLRYRPMLDI